MISHLDAAVGRVVEALKDMGLYEETILLFAGDNGLAVGQHGLMGKQNLYEHSIRVPLIFAGPGVPKGQQREAFCYLSDIFPTLCELLDLPLPSTVEGSSLVPCFSDSRRRIRRTMFYAYVHLMRAVRDDRYKLIDICVERIRVTQLFDLQADPWEMHNLAEDRAHIETLERLRNELVRWRDELDDRGQWGERFWQAFGRTRGG